MRLRESEIRLAILHETLVKKRAKELVSYSTSNPSGTTTRSASPIAPSEERHQQRRMQLAGEREASEPRKQFSAQVEEERRRIWNADPSTS